MVVSGIGMRPKCQCGTNCKPNGYKINGDAKYYTLCSTCRKNKSFIKQKVPPKRKSDLSSWLRKFKEPMCKTCGFIPEHPCQLDVDHIDGNSKNNKPENYQTLCANCHRREEYKIRIAS